MSVIYKCKTTAPGKLNYIYIAKRTLEMAVGGKLKWSTDIEFKSYSLENIYFLFARDVTVRKQ